MAIKIMVQEKNNRVQEKKSKKATRLDEIKKQLRQGYSLRPMEQQPVARKIKHSKKKKNVQRTLSAINKEWDAMESSEDAMSVSIPEPNANDDGLPSPKSKKTVTFAV
ncbi:hypothetical protein EV175_000190 [Coemansia sp. RSA 1933]|nr:hypothetical protein EV175_000190 [Coemansia sp. RSA 1933]